MHEIRLTLRDQNSQKLELKVKVGLKSRELMTKYLMYNKSYELKMMK